MSKILVRVDANPKIGWGHFYRSLALAEMLKEHFSLQFAMMNPHPEALVILRDKGFSCISLPEQQYSAPGNRGNHEFRFDLADYLENIDIVLLDGYWFGPVYQKALRGYPVKIALIEDDGKGSFVADMIINHAPGITEEAYMTDVQEPLFALGPKYSLLRHSFLKAAQEKYTPKSEPNKVLICFGGSDYTNITTKAVRWLIENTATDIQVILGIDFQNIEELKKVISKAPERVQLRNNFSDYEMVTAMKSADVGVLPASGILFESIACRLPSITGVYTQNQLAIFHGFLEKEVVVDAENFGDLSTAWAKLTKGNLHEVQQRQAKVIDGRSSARMIKLFQQLI